MHATWQLRYDEIDEIDEMVAMKATLLDFAARSQIPRNNNNMTRGPFSFLFIPSAPSPLSSVLLVRLEKLQGNGLDIVVCIGRVLYYYTWKKGW